MMNLIEFSKILSNPSAISKGQTRDLDQVIEEHPYFQAAHFLRLYALKKQRSFRYNDSLKKTAAYTTDRELLFNYITNFDFELQAAEPQVTELTADDPDLNAAVNLAPAEETAKEQEPEAAAGEELPLGKPLDFKKEESYSFGEWLQLSQLKPIDRTPGKESREAGERPRTGMDLINEFLAKSPKIKPSESVSYDDLAEESATENEQLMTETLAHVYLEQKKYDKAIAAFTVLSLKYPEKSSFFADRIEAVRKLQNN